jgi:hypothetical protein
MLVKQFNTPKIKGNPVILKVSTQLNLNSVNKRTEFHVTIALNETVHRCSSPCQPFGTHPKMQFGYRCIQQLLLIA